MAEDVKRPRRYESPRRQEGAAETRRSILAAAQRLFVEHGYASTSVAAIAREARVATKTVYVAFETKSGVLRAVWNLLLRGDEGSAPVAERDWYRAVLAEPDPQRQLRMAASASRSVKERVGGLLGVIRNGAPVDPEVGALWDRIEREFHDNQRAIVESLAARDALRDGLDVATATDVLWTLNHPDVWLLLVGKRGWTAEQWERWFADAAGQQLLG